MKILHATDRRVGQHRLDHRDGAAEILGLPKPGDLSILGFSRRAHLGLGLPCQTRRKQHRPQQNVHYLK